MGEPHKPENKEKHHEKYWVDNSHEFQANLLPKILVSRGSSSPPDLHVLLRCLWLRSESLYVGLDDDVHEGLEETEDEPAVDHLDVGGVGEAGVDTE